MVAYETFDKMRVFKASSVGARTVYFSPEVSWRLKRRSQSFLRGGAGVPSETWVPGGNPASKGHRSSYLWVPKFR